MKCKCMQFLMGLLMSGALAWGDVSLKDGQWEQQIPLVTIATLSGEAEAVTLRYSTADLQQASDLPNERAEIGWTGAGWSIETGRIVVEHNGTVDINDDRWFLIGGTGATGEIVRVNQNGGMKYILRG